MPLPRITCTALLLLTSSTAALAQEAAAERGFYLGGSITQSRFDEDNFSFSDLDDEDNSWKIIGGFRFTPQIAVEANYVDFGEASAPALIGVPAFNAEAKAFALYGIGMLPAGPIDLFAKVGAAQIDAETRGRIVSDDDATEFAYGGGAQLRLGALGIRAEYEKFDTDIVGDLDLISLGLTYTFSPRM
jgi:OOP family OmpA-OmpF porin